MENPFKLNRVEIIVLSIGFLGGFLSRGIALFSSGYGIDDYAYLTKPMDFSFGFSQGRWGAGIFNQFLDCIGISGVYSTTVLVFLSFVLISYVGVLICRVWNISNNILLSLLVVLFFVTYPYQTEIYTFKIANAGFAFPMFFAFLSIYLSKYNIKSVILNSFLFAFAVSMYQIVLSYALVTILFLIIINFLNDNSSKVWVKLKNSLQNKLFISRSGVFFVGFTIYLILNKVILKLFNTGIVERGEFIRPDAIMVRFADAKSTIVKVFFNNEVIMPTFLKGILLLILVLSIFSVIKYFCRDKSNKNIILNIVIFLFMISFFLVSFLIPLLPLKDWYPVPRVISTISLIWGGLFVIVYYKGTFFKKNYLLVICGLILIFGFIGINNHILIDQLRINRFDENKANRIISRIEENSKFINVKKIAIIGGSWRYPVEVETIQGDMNISAFGAEWAKVPLINEISGYSFLEPTKEQAVHAKELCNTTSKWPSEESVFIIDDLAVACL